jgi:oligo-1,6-glucosidase
MTCRSPIIYFLQWSAEKYGGFTTGTPWMNVNTDFETWNVAAQESDPNSVLSFWRSALKFRAAHDVLVSILLPLTPAYLNSD